MYASVTKALIGVARPSGSRRARNCCLPDTSMSESDGATRAVPELRTDWRRKVKVVKRGAGRRQRGNARVGGSLKELRSCLGIDLIVGRAMDAARALKEEEIQKVAEEGGGQVYGRVQGLYLEG